MVIRCIAVEMKKSLLSPASPITAVLLPILFFMSPAGYDGTGRAFSVAEAARDAFTGVRQGAEVSTEVLFLNCFSGWGLLLAPVLLTAGTALLVTEGQRTGASMFTKVREGRTLYALARAAGPLLAGGILLTAVSLLSFLVLSVLCPGFYAAGGTDGAFFGLPASRAGFLVSLLLDSFLAGILFSVPGTLAAAVFQDRYMLLCLPFLITYAVRQVLLRLAMEGVITFELYDLMDAAAHIGRGRPEGTAAAAALALAGLLASFLAWRAEAERGR